MTTTLTKPIAAWHTAYETGNLEVDTQHQELFEIVNSLHDAVITSRDFSVLQEILNCLTNHTVEHFHTEEALMMSANYPDYERHKQIHDYLIAKVVNLLHKFRDREASITTDITQFLTEWLTHHIKGEDQKMIQFFQNK
ncbi:hemerythrin family protein [Pseudanabaena sp. FACHB-1998]|uniref:bacteriohemerythrin n=1 Tax=Pseudanabaena sp. FACHB-1998 TaxID=2692858 RepID=UPI001680CCAD|nr:bacteriohemerythrin [Pseudanabaena sp. FACHB-1998]MBD2176022.1 hemerythrin family protein [Pseudanabaena sp. FACHB-1998]